MGEVLIMCRIGHMVGSCPSNVWSKHGKMGSTKKCGLSNRGNAS